MSEPLDFTIKTSGDLMVVFWHSGGFRPATDVELSLFAEVERLRTENAELTRGVIAYRASVSRLEDLLTERGEFDT